MKYSKVLRVVNFCFAGRVNELKQVANIILILGAHFLAMVSFRGVGSGAYSELT